MFSTASEAAGGIAGLGWGMFLGAAALFALVMGLTAWAVWGRTRLGHQGQQRLILAGGFGLPVVVLSALLGYSVSLGESIVARHDPEALQVEVTAHRFWWEVRYLNCAPQPLVTANEIHLPKDRPVQFILRSSDVIHSFWVPALAGKIDMVPGRINFLQTQPTRLGAFRGQCAEFCGEQHAKMALWVVVREPADFDRWVARESAPPPPPAGSDAAAGARLFLEAGCGTCHRVAGTPAQGRQGPDLSHVASRRTIGAGILPANANGFAAWIADVQHLKAAAPMPSYDVLDGAQLNALAAYLAGLQ